MKYLYYEFNAGNNNVIQVTLNGWANVLLLDDLNFQNYKSGRRYSYYGGKAEVSPFNIRPPRYSHWNLIIDRGGYPGEVAASINIV